MDKKEKLIEDLRKCWNRIGYDVLRASIEVPDSEEDFAILSKDAVFSIVLDRAYSTNEIDREFFESLDAKELEEVKEEAFPAEGYVF